MDAGTSYAVFGSICFDEDIFLNATGFGTPRVWSDSGLIQIDRDVTNPAFSIQPWYLLVPTPYNDAVWKFFSIWLLRRDARDTSSQHHRLIYREMMEYLFMMIQNGELDGK